MWRSASFLTEHSAASTQEWEPRAVECSSSRLQAVPLPCAQIAGVEHHVKRRRVGEACVAAPPPGPCSLALLGSAADDTLLSNGSQDGTASLCCVETSLEDCSSVEPEAEGFAVYQSPLSLEAEGAGAGHACGGGCGGAAGAAEPLVLADLAQHPLACDPDLEEMLSVLYDMECELQPSAAYLEQHGPCAQPDAFLDASMRRTAASWLVEVAAEFGLHQETLFLANALLDRFLTAAKGVPRTQLQLVGVACMLIASKHEEEMHPSVLDFTNIADNCFVPGDLLRMEAIVLDCLSFRINTPTAHTFLSMFKQALALQPRACALASYLTELAMLEYELLHFKPSHIASAATLLAKLYTNDTQGISLMPNVTNYSTDELKPCMRHLLALQRAAHSACDYSSPYLAVREKYGSHQWFCVAATTPFLHLPTSLLAAAQPVPRGAKRPAASAKAPPSGRA